VKGGGGKKTRKERSWYKLVEPEETGAGAHNKRGKKRGGKRIRKRDAMRQSSRKSEAKLSDKEQANRD